MFAVKSSSARRLRKDGAVVELIVDKSLITGYSPDSIDVSTKTGES
jgi:hypothetical protein